MWTRYERLIAEGDQEEAAFAIEALFRGAPEHDPDAPFLGALLFGRLILGFTLPPKK